MLMDLHHFNAVLFIAEDGSAYLKPWRSGIIQMLDFYNIDA